jgi:di/tricarboxylate transporter
MAIWIVTAMLLATLVLLVTEWLPVDLIAIGIMVVLILTGILEPLEAVSGFANPAVITVGALFIISKAMVRTGTVGFIGRKVIQYSRGNANLAMILTLLIVTLASAFINNTPVVMLFIPIITSLSCEYDFSPSKLLIPVSYASILAGTCTLIGTSTNIIVSDLSAMYGYSKLSMFELSSLGIPIALLGVAFLFVVAPRLMPGHAQPVCEMHDRENRRYLAELLVPPGSALIGREAQESFRDKYPSFEVFEVVRDSHVLYPDRDRVVITAGDLLLVKGSALDIVNILDDQLVKLAHPAEEGEAVPGHKQSIIVELIIPPQSSLLGQRLLDTPMYPGSDVHLLGVKSRTLHYAEQKIRNVKLRIGDIILVQCHEDRVEQLRGNPDFIVVEDVHHEMVHRGKAPLAMVIFTGLVAAASLGLADIMVCALAAVFLMILTGCLQLRDAYRAMSGNVLLLIIGTIALGTAMEKTGAARYYAEIFLSFSQALGPQVVLSCILVFTSISTQVLSNNATAVLAIPIAVSTALTLGVSPRPFIIAVCFGASACYATPIGYQTNLLVYGPGGYRFSDYLKLGIPLNLLVLIMGSIFIPVLWPF